MVSEHLQIAKITATHLGYEDHGIFSVNVNFDYGHSGQGTGHYYVAASKPSDSDAAGIRVIRAIVDACGVSRWEDVAGCTVYAVRDNDGWGGMVIGIEPLPFAKRGKGFRFKDVLAERSPGGASTAAEAAGGDT